jgi:hypothetical protein
MGKQQDNNKCIKTKSLFQNNNPRRRRHVPIFSIDEAEDHSFLLHTPANNNIPTATDRMKPGVFAGSIEGVAADCFN